MRKNFKDVSANLNFINDREQLIQKGLENYWSLDRLLNQAM